MEKKFKETNIPDDYAKSLAKMCLVLGPAHTDKIATTLFHGVSTCLGSVKSVTIPKAVVFRLVDHTFLAAAKVEYIKNENDPSNPSAGRWDYVWTTFEDDIKGADVIDVATNSLVTTYFIASAASLYSMRFQDTSSCVQMMTSLLEMIIQWCKENATDAEPAVLTLAGVFKATGEVEDGKVIVGIVPDGDMKVLIKEDERIQEQ